MSPGKGSSSDPLTDPETKLREHFQYLQGLLFLPEFFCTHREEILRKIDFLRQLTRVQDFEAAIELSLDGLTVDEGVLQHPKGLEALVVHAALGKSVEVLEGNKFIL